MSDSYELPSFPFTAQELNRTFNEDEEAIPRRRGGRIIMTTFPLPPQGGLPHPYIDWKIDKTIMERYMHDYAKQEGFAINHWKEHGIVIHFRCIHAGKYNNFHRLPAEVMDKKQREELLESGILYTLFN
jgi:hypothetical protein